MRMTASAANQLEKLVGLIDSAREIRRGREVQVVPLRGDRALVAKRVTGVLDQ